ncbi:MAG: hypothetical protein JNK82_34755 [Myxococcaceae bacterium]|nr:hypothetical protein [Myxococcaceae bacterium]
MGPKVHPVIGAFLDVRSALDVLERGVSGTLQSPQEAAFVSAAKAHPELSAFVLQAKGKTRPSEESQNATILLAVRAALSVLPGDPALGPPAKKAREALSTAGADDEQIEQLLGGVLVEEAFTGDSDPTHFDPAFVVESFGELLELAKLDADVVNDLVERFAETSKPEARPLYLSVAESLFDAAWGEGPQSVNVEHVEDCLTNLVGDESELTGVKTTLEVLLRFLAAHRFIGPLRLERLLGHLKAWSLADAEDGEADEDAIEDDDLDDDEADDSGERGSSN